MAIESFDELLAQLRQRPEWRDELRRLVLTDRLLSLPDNVDRFVVGLTELVEAQQATEGRLEALTAHVQTLTQRMDSLAERMESLVEQMSGVATRTDELTGFMIEQRYRQRAHAYFAPIARRIHVLSGDELDALLDNALERGVLQEREAQELRWADAVIQGRPDGEPVYLVIEASAVVDARDVERAASRAALLAMAGVLALPVVAGTTVIPDAFRQARERDVWVVTDGRIEHPGTAA